MVAWVVERAAERAALSLVSPLASEASSTMTPPVRAACASDFCCLAALRSALRRRSVSIDAGDSASSLAAEAMGEGEEGEEGRIGPLVGQPTLLYAQRPPPPHTPLLDLLEADDERKLETPEPPPLHELSQLPQPPLSLPQRCLPLVLPLARTSALVIASRMRSVSSPCC